MSDKPRLSSARVSALIRIAREHPDLDDLAVEALAIVQTAPRVRPDPGDEMPDPPPADRRVVRTCDLSADEMARIAQATVETDRPYSLDDIPDDDLPFQHPVQSRFRLSTTGEARLSDDERRLVAQRVNQARKAVLTQIAGLRQARRAADIRARATTEIPRLLGMPAETVVLSTADHDTAAEMMQVIENERTKCQPFIVFMDVIGIVEVHDNSTGAWKITKHHI